MGGGISVLTLDQQNKLGESLDKFLSYEKFCLQNNYSNVELYIFLSSKYESLLDEEDDRIQKSVDALVSQAFEGNDSSHSNTGSTNKKGSKRIKNKDETSSKNNSLRNSKTRTGILRATSPNSRDDVPISGGSLSKPNSARLAPINKDRSGRIKLPSIEKSDKPRSVRIKLDKEKKSNDDKNNSETSIPSSTNTEFSSLGGTLSPSNYPLSPIAQIISDTPVIDQKVSDPSSSSLMVTFTNSNNPGSIAEPMEASSVTPNSFYCILCKKNFDNKDMLVTHEKFSQQHSNLLEIHNKNYESQFLKAKKIGEIVFSVIKCFKQDHPCNIWYSKTCERIIKNYEDREEEKRRDRGDDYREDDDDEHKIKIFNVTPYFPVASTMSFFSNIFSRFPKGKAASVGTTNPSGFGHGFGVFSNHSNENSLSQSNLNISQDENSKFFLFDLKSVIAMNTSISSSPISIKEVSTLNLVPIKRFSYRTITLKKKYIHKNLLINKNLSSVYYRFLWKKLIKNVIDIIRLKKYFVSVFNYQKNYKKNLKLKKSKIKKKKNSKDEKSLIPLLYKGIKKFFQASSNFYIELHYHKVFNIIELIYFSVPYTVESIQELISLYYELNPTTYLSKVNDSHSKVKKIHSLPEVHRIYLNYSLLFSQVYGIPKLLSDFIMIPKHTPHDSEFVESKPVEVPVPSQTVSQTNPHHLFEYTRSSIESAVSRCHCYDCEEKFEQAQLALRKALAHLNKKKIKKTKKKDLEVDKKKKDIDDDLDEIIEMDKEDNNSIVNNDIGLDNFSSESESEEEEEDLSNELVIERLEEALSTFILNRLKVNIPKGSVNFPPANLQTLRIEAIKTIGKRGSIVMSNGSVFGNNSVNSNSISAVSIDKLQLSEQRQEEESNSLMLDKPNDLIPVDFNMLQVLLDHEKKIIKEGMEKDNSNFSKSKSFLPTISTSQFSTPTKSTIIQKINSPTLSGSISSPSFPSLVPNTPGSSNSSSKKSTLVSLPSIGSPSTSSSLFSTGSPSVSIFSSTPTHTQRRPSGSFIHPHLLSPVNPDSPRSFDKMNRMISSGLLPVSLVSSEDNLENKNYNTDKLTPKGSLTHNDSGRRWTFMV